MVRDEGYGHGLGSEVGQLREALRRFRLSSGVFVALHRSSKGLLTLAVSP